MVSKVYGKKAPAVGITPAIALVNPKYSHNVGAALRAASCFGVRQLWFSGDRVSLDPTKKRLPREERMKGYEDVELFQFDYFFDAFDHCTPVAVELRETAEVMTYFEHPENALYVFGPEDDSLTSVALQHCHRSVVIPTRHCTNLAAAVYITLYDRQLKRQLAGLDPVLPAAQILNEARGFIEPDYESL
jgi:tRNA(Leu) C34 or U34 (ribose-2'-O)-methylase TrmL